MADLVPLEKAAQILGVSTEELNNMRLRNEIFGTRDGASWKFKADEIKRVADEKGINIAPDSGLLDESAELQLEDSAELIRDSDSAADEELKFGSSDIRLAGDSDVLADDEPSDKGSPSDTGKLLADSADLELSEDDLFDDELSLSDSPGLVDSAELSSDFEDSDLVLEDSDSSDDPAAGGEVKMSPTESGISDEAFELGGSDLDSLELPEDEDVLALEDSAALLKSDDDFNLTPLEDDPLDDSTSGSQVIALEDSAIYTDDSAPTVLGDSDSQSFDTGTAPQMIESQSDIMPGTVAVAPEAPYTIFNIIALAAALLLVAVGTMVAFDLGRQIWQPDDTTLSNTIADFFIRMAGFEP